jgi:hypothetical protein
MNEEYSALQRNETWELVPPKKGINLIDNKWVFEVKRKVDGSVRGSRLDWWPKALNKGMV